MVMKLVPFGRGQREQGTGAEETNRERVRADTAVNILFNF